MRSSAQHRGAGWSIYLCEALVAQTQINPNTVIPACALQFLLSVDRSMKHAVFSLAAHAISHRAVSEAVQLLLPSITFNLASRFCRKCLLFLFSLSVADQLGCALSAANLSRSDVLARVPFKRLNIKKIYIYIFLHKWSSRLGKTDLYRRRNS